MGVMINRVDRDSEITWAVIWDTPDFTMHFVCRNVKHAKNLAKLLEDLQVRRIEVAPGWIANLSVK